MNGWIFWITVAAVLLALVRRPLPIALSLLGGTMFAMGATEVRDGVGPPVFTDLSALASNAHGNLQHRFIHGVIAGFAFFLFLALLPRIFSHLDWLPGRPEPPKN